MRVLYISNSSGGMYLFRRELIEETGKIADVYLCAPPGDYQDYWETIGCRFVPYEFERHGTNPLKELKHIKYYKKLLKDIMPDVCLTYTIKPNIYGGIACSRKKIPYMPNITGLGDSIENGGLISKVSVFLYRKSMKHASCVFFQNRENRDIFLRERIITGNNRLIPGSGVNPETFGYEPYPEERGVTHFLFVGRITRDKGIEELLSAADITDNAGHSFVVDVVGYCEGDYKDRLAAAEEKGNVIYHGPSKDVRSFYADCDCVVLPSYHEGTSNVLLEASATGRPVIASDIPGCRETFDEGISGLACKPKSDESLAKAMISFLLLPYEKRKNMGIAAREKIIKEYDRRIVIDAYKDEINKALGQ